MWLARLVRHVTAQVDGLGDGHSRLHPLPYGSALVGVELDDGDRLNVLLPWVGLVLGESVRAQDRPFGDCPARLFRIETTHAGPMHDGGEGVDADASQIPRALGGYPTHRVWAKAGPLAQTGHEDPPRTDPPQCVNEGHFAERTLDLPLRDQLGYAAAEHPVHGARGPAGLLDALEQIHDDGAQSMLGYVARNNLDLHARLLTRRYRPALFRIPRLFGYSTTVRSLPASPAACQL